MITNSAVNTGLLVMITVLLIVHTIRSSKPPAVRAELDYPHPITGGRHVLRDASPSRRAQR